MRYVHSVGFAEDILPSAEQDEADCYDSGGAWVPGKYGYKCVAVLPPMNVPTDGGLTALKVDKVVLPGAPGAKSSGGGWVLPVVLAGAAALLLLK